ncbi:HlyD family secretion protein [Sphingopyxis sp. GW247-27LB]|uniref:HlyD family secretion protein n=1 Tax=Sphingopyxis sp. GW247-27LB TaxID=2012632 RepID=UPI001595D83E|nr:efflux RND transporter periplasmic adaptor subunit [Sphingopyxis sp. GW247-27LB]
MGLIAVILTLLAALSWFAYLRLQPEPPPAQVVYGSGRIEVDEVRLAPQFGGRLLDNLAIEGTTVASGTVVARVDPADYKLHAEQADAQRTATQIAVSQFDAQISLAQHHARTALTDLRRFESLKSNGWITARQLDTARNSYEAAASQVSVLIRQRAEANAQSQAAGKSAALARSRVTNTQVIAPLTGAVLERLAEPGEIVASGQPVAILANLGRVRLKIFIPETDLGKIRLGAPARLKVDAFPDRTFAARVSQVDAQAQFTPRDVHLQEERSRTVYGVTLEAENPSGLLKPGMPADAWILWDAGKGWPARLRVPE